MMNITDNHDNIDEETEARVGGKQTYKVKERGDESSFYQR